MENLKPIPPAFKVGDTVKLKSGGPLMTVKVLKNTMYQDEKGNINEGFVGFIACNWFDSITTELKVELFKQEMLIAYPNTGGEEKNIPVVINKII